MVYSRSYLCPNTTVRNEDLHSKKSVHAFAVNDGVSHRSSSFSSCNSQEQGILSRFLGELNYQNLAPFQCNESIFHALCSPIGTFLSTNQRFLSFLEKIFLCGKKSLLLEDKETGIQKIVQVFCDNRICQCSDCQSHRDYKFEGEHEDQILKLKQSILKPKAWIFTTPKLPYPIDRYYLQDKLKFLFSLLSKYSLTPFSIFLELKLHRADYYLHFHVVSGFIKGLKKVRKLWGFQIKYETAIKKDNLGYYISKYATKNPSLIDEEEGIELTPLHLLHYGMIVYKLQMVRFSIGHEDRVKEASKYMIVGFNYSEILEFGVKYSDFPLYGATDLLNFIFLQSKGKDPPIENSKNLILSERKKEEVLLPSEYSSLPTRAKAIVDNLNNDKKMIALLTAFVMNVISEKELEEKMK